ncbi:MAG: DUF4352 domain-containing protein [Candidatus Micrarchaeota archaeon]|nr:DUF4352 domain-containing protein [Candidatus Micrarchaeota archaeon]
MTNLFVFSVLLISVLFLAGCASSGILKSSPDRNKLPEGPEIVVTSNATEVSSLTWYTGTRLDYPSDGNTYVVVNVKIENHGYETFRLWSPGFRLIHNGLAYSPEASNQFLLKDTLPSNTDILDGGLLSGNIVFEVPSNLSGYDIRYSAEQGDYNIVYR